MDDYNKTLIDLAISTYVGLVMAVVDPNGDLIHNPNQAEPIRSALKAALLSAEKLDELKAEWDAYASEYKVTLPNEKVTYGTDEIWRTE